MAGSFFAPGIVGPLAGARWGVAGGLIGAAYGAATSDSMTSTGQFRDAVGGAMSGATIGAASGMLARGLVNKGSPLRRGIAAAPGAAWRFAKKHPWMALAGIGLGVGLGLNAAYGNPPADPLGKSPELLRSAGVSSTGFDPGFGADPVQQAHQQFMESTEGLVQGLHRRRH